MSRPRCSPPCTSVMAFEPQTVVKRRPRGCRSNLRWQLQPRRVMLRGSDRPPAAGCWRHWRPARRSTLGSPMCASTCTAPQAGACSSRCAPQKVREAPASRSPIHLHAHLTQCRPLLQWMRWKPAPASAAAGPWQGRPPSPPSATPRCWRLRLALPGTRLRADHRLDPRLSAVKRTLQARRSRRHLAPKTMTPDEMQSPIQKTGKLSGTRCLVGGMERKRSRFYSKLQEPPTAGKKQSAHVNKAAACC